MSLDVDVNIPYLVVWYDWQLDKELKESFGIDDQDKAIDWFGFLQEHVDKYAKFYDHGELL